MNLQQLRIVRETVRQDFNLTKAANALFTSQSGASKHIKDLEDELGVELFVRRGKRLVGLTAPGKELIAVVERMLRDADNVRRLAEQFSHSDRGQLTVVTTHTQARYALPPVVARFKKIYPKVHLVLYQAGPSELAAMLQQGEADIGIATESVAAIPECVSFPYYTWQHCVIVPPGHPLEAARPLSLEAIAAHPVVTYHEGFTGRGGIDEAFAREGLALDVVMSALDADVIKAYVALGLGVGIVASMAVDAERDAGLHMLDGAHLFPRNTTRIAIHRGHYLRGFAYRFIELCEPSLTEAVVRGAVKPVREL